MSARFGSLGLRAAWLPLVALLATIGSAYAQSDKYYEAYYLEHEKHDPSAAAKLYAEVAGSSRVDAELRTKARIALARVNEEISTRDFARLMPANTLVYVEVNQPGKQLSELLRQLGLLGEGGLPTAGKDPQVRISPALVQSLLGMRGAAAAVTGFDPVRQAPMGVVVAHFGDMAIARGLIETALPVAAEPADPIEGFPTYDIEGEAFVTLTHSLMIASQQRAEIAGVIERLQDGDAESLATNADLREALKGREGALVFACVNARPVLPLLKMGMAAGAAQSRELAIAQAILDLESFESLTIKAGISAEGLALDISLRLAHNHRNLIYNLLRLPPVDEQTLASIPSGAAAFFAAALNERGASVAPKRTSADGPVVVTGLDFARELFANVIGIAVYALPATESAKGDGPPIPDIAACITVNDPTKSEALWTQILGLASMASGAGAMQGAGVKLAGHDVRRFDFPGSVSIYVANVDDMLLVGSTRGAIARSLQARAENDSILRDSAMSGGLKQITSSTTLALAVHPGRCLAIARPFMSPDEYSEVEPFSGLLDKTVASVIVSQSAQEMRLSAMLSGIPQVGELATKLIREERQGARRGRGLASAERQMRRGPEPRNPREPAAQRSGNAGSETPAQEPVTAVQPETAESLRERFEELVSQRQEAAARKVAATWFELMADDPEELNDFAWALLTEDRYAGRFYETALRFSERSNELTSGKNWMLVDTLAWAHFRNGNVDRAVELERKAIDLCADPRRKSEVVAALATFEQAQKELAAEVH